MSGQAIDAFACLADDGRASFARVRLLLVCLGSAVGGGARYLVAVAMAAAGGPGPVATWLVNVTGSFFIGLLLNPLSLATRSADLRLALTTGVLGGLTTYSTFSFETLRLLQQGSHGLAAANVCVTVVSCLLASAAGWTVAQAFAA